MAGLSHLLSSSAEGEGGGRTGLGLGREGEREDGADMRTWLGQAIGDWGSGRNSRVEAEIGESAREAPATGGRGGPEGP